MTEGDFVTFKTIGDMEEAFSPFPGAEKTRVFPILGAVRFPPNIGELDMVRELFCFKKIPQSVRLPRTEAQVDVNRHEFVSDGNALASFMEKVEQCQAILTTGDPHQNAVPLLDQTVTVDRLSHQASNLFLPISHIES